MHRHHRVTPASPLPPVRRWLTVSDIRRMQANVLVEELGIGRRLEKSIRQSVQRWAKQRRRLRIVVAAA